MEPNKDDDQVLFVTFNQDSSCIAVGTEKGYRIFNSYPFKDSFQRNLDGGIGIIELLNRCNVIALVGGGKKPKYAPNKVILWDEKNESVINTFRFTSSVKNVKLKREKIFVICEESKIYVFAFSDFQNIDTIDTFVNPKGLVAINQETKSSIIAFPDEAKGYARIKNYDTNTNLSFKAHTSEIGFLAMNYDGTLLSTASERGTLIRLFKSIDGTLLHEVRRGSEIAEICSICFEPNGQYIACSSTKGTIHIFTMKKEDSNSSSTNKNSEDTNANHSNNQKSLVGKVFNFFNIQSTYLNSEWSFAQFRIPATKSVITFGQENSIIVITTSGKYYQASFDPRATGECQKIQEKDLIPANKSN